MKTAKVIKRSISIMYSCDDGTEHSIKIENPHVRTYMKFEDMEVEVIEFTCDYCGEKHTFEI